ncbi:MAG: S8 family serine peptidase [Proteobacteria bacterium]|nr:S8 family serine peptidase [Pseudomonadota bacterium]
MNFKHTNHEIVRFLNILYFSWFFLLGGCQGQGDFLAPPNNNHVQNVDFASQATNKDQEFVDGSYIVNFRTSNSDNNLNFANFFQEFQTHYLQLADDYLADSRVLNIDVLTSAKLTQDPEWLDDFPPPVALQSFWAINNNEAATGVIAKVDFTSESDAQDLLKEWDAEGRIWFAEPNGISRLSVANQWESLSKTYTGLDNTWHKQIGLIEAFNTLTTSKTVQSDEAISSLPPIIAVLDSGVDYEHPNLKSSIWVNSQPGAAGCDNDLHGCNTTAPSKGSLGNGDVWPVGASGPNTAVEGKGSHGTHVAGLIAAQPGSSRSIGGVCPVCKVMILKVAEIEKDSTSGTPGITDDSQIRALKYVTRFKSNSSNAVRIVNSSFGKYTRSKSVAILVDVLKRQGNGTMVIAAASNEDSMIRSYPGALANAIGVSAVDQEGRKATFSNFGPWVDIAAPGDKLRSTYPGGQEEASSGTSMASPVVAGAAGLYLAAFPNVNFQELRNRILDCADSSLYSGSSDAAKFNSQYYFPKIDGEESRRPLLGSGIVNVNNMISGSSCKGSVGRPLDRVTAGCAAIAVKHKQRHQPSEIYLVLLFLPLIFMRGIISNRETGSKKDLNQDLRSLARG